MFASPLRLLQASSEAVLCQHRRTKGILSIRCSLRPPLAKKGDTSLSLGRAFEPAKIWAVAAAVSPYQTARFPKLPATQFLSCVKRHGRKCHLKFDKTSGIPYLFGNRFGGVPDLTYFPKNSEAQVSKSVFLVFAHLSIKCAPVCVTIIGDGGEKTLVTGVKLVPATQEKNFLVQSEVPPPLARRGSILVLPDWGGGKKTPTFFLVASTYVTNPSHPSPFLSLSPDEKKDLGRSSPPQHSRISFLIVPAKQHAVERYQDKKQKKKITREKSQKHSQARVFFFFSSCVRKWESPSRVVPAHFGSSSAPPASSSALRMRGLKGEALTRNGEEK